MALLPLLLLAACDQGQVELILSETSEEVRVDTLYGACSDGEPAYVAEVLVEGYDAGDMRRTLTYTVAARTEEADRGVTVQLYVREDHPPDDRQHRLRLTSNAERMGLEPGRSYVLDVAEEQPDNSVAFRTFAVDIPRCD